MALKGGYVTTDPRLDRIPGKIDEQARVRPLLLGMTAGDVGALPTPRSCMYKTYVQLNQGPDGACVGFAHTQAACTAPKDKAQQNLTFDDARALYLRAQILDDIPGQEPSEQGSTTVAGAQAAVEKGWYGSFLWAKNLKDIRLALAYIGPVVIGISWYQNMFNVDSNNTISIENSGIAGGHDTLLNGVDEENQRLRLHNSWGPQWGDNGEVWLSFNDMDRLINEPEADACVPLRKVINVRQAQEQPNS